MEAACATVTSVRGTVPAGMVYRARAVGELAGKVTLRLRGCYCVWLGRKRGNRTALVVMWMCDDRCGMCAGCDAMQERSAMSGHVGVTQNRT